MEQLIQCLLQQRRRQELERVPDQRAAQPIHWKIECRRHELVHSRGVGLIFERIGTVAKRQIQSAEYVIVIDPVTQAGDERDIGLARARDIQNRCRQARSRER